MVPKLVPTTNDGWNFLRNAGKVLILQCAPVAQLDRAFDYESKGRKFESCRAHHKPFILLSCPIFKSVVPVHKSLGGLMGVIRQFLFCSFDLTTSEAPSAFIAALVCSDER